MVVLTSHRDRLTRDRLTRDRLTGDRLIVRKSAGLTESGGAE